LSLEVSPPSALHDFPLVEGEEVDAVVFQLLGIVSMGDEHDLEDGFYSYKLLEIAGADVNQSWQHEVVSID
jgi:hypothetical protein